MYSKYTGIILKKFPVNEADELLTIYTKEIGKMRVKAVANRKIESRLGGYLQSLNEIEFETARSRRGFASRSLPVLISVRARTINNYLRENLKKFAYALVGIETLYRLTPDYEVNAEAYEAILDFLRGLGSQSGSEAVQVRIFQLRLLACSGYRFPAGQETLSKEAKNQLRALESKEPVREILPEVEREIDNFLNFVLEREIRANGFVEALKQEA